MLPDPEQAPSGGKGETVTNPGPVDPAATATFGPGLVGPYGDATPHAKGGLGEVFRATDPALHRSVAIKRLHAHRAADPASRRRFLVEAEVTARLEHPGVVPVYALYADSPGGPAYAMRFVEGPTLADAIKAYHAGPPDAVAFRRLLQAVLQVCQTVAYAHSRGVIHRDLKPQNVLLGRFGETLVVDWGLAKVVGRPEDARADAVGEGTLMPQSGGSDDAATQMGSAVGTPAYMSPEQAAGRWNVIDQRSDVYGLGAVLYTVLTGRPPLDSGDWPEMQQRIQRGRIPPARQIKSDVPRALETVCRKAMAVEPAERYATASGLAGDLEHWLADEPVAAYREPIAARARRWMRHHRTAVTAATVLLLAAVAGLSVGTILLQRARQDTEAQRQAAVTAHQRSVALNRFLIDDLLKQADPVNNPVGDKITVIQLLDKAADRLESETALSGQPAAEAEVREVIGHAYEYLDADAKAENQYRIAWALRERTDGPADEKTLAVRNRMVWERIFILPADQVEGDATAALAACVASLGEDHLVTATARSHLGEVRKRQGRHAQAVELMEQAWKTARRLLPESAVEILVMENALGTALVFAGRAAEAEEHFQSVVAGYQKHAPTSPDLMNSEMNLAGTLNVRGRFSAAEQILRAAIPRSEKSRGEFSQDVLSARNLLGQSLEGQQRWSEAEATYAAVLKDRREHEKLPQGIVRVLMNRARLVAKQRRWDEAASDLAEAILTDRPDPNRTVAPLKEAIARSLDPKTDAAAAEPVLAECQGVLNRVMVGGDWLRAWVNARYADCLIRLDHVAEAEPVLLRSADEILRAAGAPVWSQRDACQRVIELFKATKRPPEAAAWQSRLAKLPADAKE